MYHPYFRGKQFELLAIKELAELIAQSDFVPIIEPVRLNTGGLLRTVQALSGAEGRCVIVINPKHGEFQREHAALQAFFRENFDEGGLVSAGILLNERVSAEEAIRLNENFGPYSPMLIHDGFLEEEVLGDRIGLAVQRGRHAFIENGRFRRATFGFYPGSERTLVGDGFTQRNNADYLPIEPFSDLNTRFRQEGYNGFGDFLIMPDSYSEGGGPAYAVAVHITFIDPDRNNALFVRHFVSRTRDTQDDPAGKFQEALDLLAEEIERPDTKLLRTDALNEFLELQRVERFRGLGYSKKLSMKHHIELMANHLAR